MATSTIRKAIGAVKDQTSISIAKVAGTVAADLEVMIVKVTTHDNEPPDERYVRVISNMVSTSRRYASASVLVISRRLSKTHDWIVALKALMLLHRLLNDGDPVFVQEIMYASKNGTGIINMSDFRDEAHSNSWDYSAFVRNYATYLDQKLEFMAYKRKLSVSDDEKKRVEDDLNESRKEKNEVTLVKEMEPEKVLEKLHQLLRLLDRFLACKPTGEAKNTRTVMVAVKMLVKESFKLYSDTFEALVFLYDCFSELDYDHCAKAFDCFSNASKMIDELVKFYIWCDDVGAVKSAEFPEVQLISDKFMGTLKGLLREKGNKQINPKKSSEEFYTAISEEKAPEANKIKSLPPPNQQVTEDLVNLKDDGVSVDEQGKILALALFSSDKEPATTSAWENEDAESGMADWELALVESASNLSKQKADLAGGFDSLLLNGMYDQGTIRQHVNNSQFGGSASSVALPGTMSKSTTTMLALPAPDGTVQPVGQRDPFAASLLVPPPSYVQIADMERKQRLLVQEQQVWQQYASNGMQEMPQLNGLGQRGSYYYTSY